MCEELIKFYIIIINCINYSFSNICVCVGSDKYHFTVFYLIYIMCTLKDPSVFIHCALESHPPLFVRHSLISLHSTPFPTKPS